VSGNYPSFQQNIITHEKSILIMASSNKAPGLLVGKKAIITGGAGGMGLAHARHLARLGADVAIFDIDLKIAKRWDEKLDAPTVAEEIRGLGVDCLTVQVDLTSAVATQAAIEQVVAKWSAIDIVINNAGGALVPYEASTATTTLDADVQRVITANLMTTVNCCRAVTPYLRRPGASIINIGSVNADVEVSGARLALYGASKAAVARYTRSLAVELGPDGIRANTLSPGVVMTARIAAQQKLRPGFTSNEVLDKIPLRRLGQPQDVSRVVEFLAGPLSEYVTGNNIRVSGGMELV
jgi:NAD(P)-dependent dehydrogenase (short-subunit alcohol dehydrogenase family)